MRESDRLRDRAGRLFALARKAHEEDKFLLAGEITKLATEARDQADEMDRAEGQVSAPPASTAPPAPSQQQQQQQEQPTSGREKK
jgi:hypothetical protein